MVDAGRARKSVNKDVHRVRRMFRWAVEEELLPPEAYQRLTCVAALAKGKTEARETGKVPPVEREHVEAVLPHLPPPVAAMAMFQLLTGTRPQEAMALRPRDLRAGDGVWYSSPPVHKTEHLDRERCVVLGPQAYAVVRPFLDRDPDAHCFSPAESVAWQRSKRRKPGGSAEVAGPAASVNPHYTRHSYRLAVQRACRRAGVPAWTPRRLRHTRASEIRHEFGTIEAARAVLGHAESRVTELYAARDLALAAEVMRKIG